MSTMSFALFSMTMFLVYSMVIAFVLHPSGEEPATPRHNRCHVESVHSIRKGLLRELNLQTEPQLPAGGLDGIREQWKSTFSTIAHKAKGNPVPALSVAPAAGNNASLQCCTIASEIVMRDLGWDNWVIYPESLTIVKCTACNPDHTLRCPASHTDTQEAHDQMPCCQPTSQKMVPILYMDELSALVISSVQLSSSCGCGLGNHQLPSEE
ncbi:gonadal somatic cell derived factor [Genypterus blacodes]|uniref:gonadal somatic cell derived factor n=1 Tax=Genypterus blacodes TaxID=154954 RepID=UPI003F76B34B